MVKAFGEVVKKVWFGNGLIMSPQLKEVVTPIIKDTVKTLGDYTVNELKAL
jgi:hypothetical protein